MMSHQTIISFCKREVVLCASGFLALLTFLFIPPSIQTIQAINFHVIASLFCLMMAISALRKAFVLDAMASRLIHFAQSPRSLAAILIFMTFFSSMAITNDVALITLVPLSLILTERGLASTIRIRIIVLQTIAANLGSSLTPVGNPQNLFIFSNYKPELSHFFFVTLPIVSLGGALLVLSLFSIPSTDRIHHNTVRSSEINRIQAIIYGILFILSVLAVFSIISIYIPLFLTIVISLYMNRDLFKTLDWGLLITFVFFFIFCGAIRQIPALTALMVSMLNKQPFLTAIITSQIISNVPAAILLSAFTNSWQSILAGVSIGGMGTLVASLASVISWKFYARQHPQESKLFLVSFTIWNVSFLLLLTAITILQEHII